MRTGGAQERVESSEESSLADGADSIISSPLSRRKVVNNRAQNGLGFGKQREEAK